MTRRPHRIAHGVSAPMRGLLLLLPILLQTLLHPSLASAQLPTRASMPESVVLVVRAVGEDQVAPVAGVVFGRNKAGDRLVAVPAAYAAAAGSLFVLEGGTDLGEDGLPARRLPPREGFEASDALAVIAVPGLQRPPIRMTFNPPPGAHEVRLAAWPPADMMANGALPFWVPINVSGKTTDQPQTLFGDATVPNLTGPLIDLCGHWAGMVIATGEPRVKPGGDGAEAPRVILNDELIGITKSTGMDASLRLEACMQVAPVGGVVLDTAPAPAGAAAREQRAPARGLAALLEDANIGTGAIVFLLSAVVSGIIFWILIKRRAAAQRRAKLRRQLQTETRTFSPTGLPTRQTRVEPQTFVPATQPPGTSGWLRIEGSHADGRPLRAVTAIRDTKFQAVIGRAGVPLAADGPGISRKHAVIVGEGGKLTISDLGGRHGTFVNGVRCQQDEVFYIEEGDKIILGAAQVTVRMSPAKGPVT